MAGAEVQCQAACGESRKEEVANLGQKEHKIMSPPRTPRAAVNSSDLPLPENPRQTAVHTFLQLWLESQNPTSGAEVPGLRAEPISWAGWPGG